jgi:hypothetical protein
MPVKLRKPKIVIPPKCIAVQDVEGGLTGRLEILITGCDPRLILVPSIWAKRVVDDEGPTGSYASIAAGVKWSIYSAHFDEKNDLKVLKPLLGWEGRTVRPADAWRPDGTLAAGDNAEISTCTPLVIVVQLAEIYNDLPVWAGQSVWFSLEAFPSDALTEADDGSDDHEAYANLVNQVAAAVPTQFRHLSGGCGGMG